MNTDDMTRMDCLRAAESGHGKVVLRTETGKLVQLWTPCYEILPGRWIAFNRRHEVSTVARMESVYMTVSDPEADVSLIPWSETPFSQEVGES